MTAKLSRADWLTFAQALPRASIDVLYADPPFNTGKPRTGLRGHSARYRDAWPTNGHYIRWLRERLQATLPALKPTANILLHIDYRTSHHVRLLLDELLGPDRFVNHLIWSYGLGGSSPRCFARKHDDILFYCVNPKKYYFHPPRVPATSRRMQGQTKKATDILDIPSLNNMATERTGYPTQKPLALLELLVEACSPPGGTVLDPCCGSGTTLVAAKNLGRIGIGCDQSAAAVRTAKKRLASNEFRTISRTNLSLHPIDT
ncbi:MAG: site-specific DNA-methyltransferase [Phycisphaeraceae bacterium]|nr:site-specific DNA-methyltransferase [Phycisphaeraceae bacterium]